MAHDPTIMRTPPARFALTLTTLVAMTLTIIQPAHADSRLQVPDGFSIEALPFELPGARQMALSADGVLYVGSLREGNVYAVADALTQPAAPRTIASGLTLPSGLAMRNGDLYVGALNRVLRFTDVDAQLKATPSGNLRSTLITADLPSERHHGWKYLGFAPDGSLYVPVGAPCNICLSQDPRFASILRMDPKTGTTEVAAHGVRNSVGFDWHPGTGELWFSDNGRDMLGDDVPAEEINRLQRSGQHFGYPFVHAGDVIDPEFGADAKPQNYVAPQVRIQAHSAALGMAFYTHDAFPQRFGGALFVAEHGSWNRSSKVGYRVSVVFFDDQGNPGEAEPFATGWLVGENNWGRPNDVLVTPDGDLLIADDQGGKIFRVSYSSSLPPTKR